MTTLLSRLRPPNGPVSGRWGFGIGDVVADATRAPEPLSDLLRFLNHFGGLSISRDAVGFDGDAVDWADVKDIETHSLVGYLVSGALDKQVDKLPLPRFPGRGLLINLLSDAALTAVVATSRGSLDRLFAVRIPAEVNYKGWLRTRTLTPGVLATLLMADPAVRDALIATAQEHGVQIRPADDDAVESAEERARKIGSILGRITSLVRN